MKSNIAACHLKLEDWKAAVESATAALDSLNNVLTKDVGKQAATDEVGNNGVVVEIEGDGEEAEKELATLTENDQRREDIARIRAKALLRRAKAKSELGGWGNLQGAEEGKLIPGNAKQRSFANG